MGVLECRQGRVAPGKTDVKGGTSRGLAEAFRGRAGKP